MQPVIPALGRRKQWAQGWAGLYGETISKEKKIKGMVRKEGKEI